MNVWIVQSEYVRKILSLVLFVKQWNLRNFTSFLPYLMYTVQCITCFYWQQNSVQVFFSWGQTAWNGRAIVSSCSVWFSVILKFKLYTTTFSANNFRITPQTKSDLLHFITRELGLTVWGVDIFWLFVCWFVMEQSCESYSSLMTQYVSHPCYYHIFHVFSCQNCLSYNYLLSFFANLLFFGRLSFNWN